jgi:hypothetical protein
VEFPPTAEMERFDTLEVDLALSCPGNRKANCPPWDYLVYMYLCDADDPARCDQEIGRWITPYWSGGRWVTDISWVLAFLHEGGPRRVGFYTQQRYEVDASFRLSNRDKGGAPRAALPLFQGGPFNLDYNSKYRPLELPMPEWATRVELVALITGHGWGDDTENCAEFCNHTHHFTVNGVEHTKEHPEAGTEMGCTTQVPMGVVPNQAGTWIYGRGGWCPGLDVPPWIADLTGDLDWTPEAVNTISYRGLFNGEDFDPQPIPDRTNFPGRIDMASYIVYWGAYDSHPSVPTFPSRLYLPQLDNGS